MRRRRLRRISVEPFQPAADPPEVPCPISRPNIAGELLMLDGVIYWSPPGDGFTLICVGTIDDAERLVAEFKETQMGKAA